MPSNPERLRKLKTYYDLFVGQQQILTSSTGSSISPAEFMSINDEIERAKADFPELIPEYPKGYFGYSFNWEFYEPNAVKMYLAGVVARFKGALTDTQTTPVTELVDFSFLTDPELREIIERDYVEIQKAYIDECWKCVIILSGGSIEAILLDRLMLNQDQAKAAEGAPAKKQDLSQWDLSELIKVAVKLKVVEPSAETLTNADRQYRNLVHPGYERRNKLQVTKLEADSARNVLLIVRRDVSATV